jgi:aryl-alcohol dehydrogenase-like predicted oxidoreductase
VANRLLVEALGRFAAARGATNAQIALAWLLHKHPHVIPIPGTRRITCLEQNAAAAELVLTAADVAELDQMFALGKVAGARYPDAGMVGIE